MPQKLSRTIGIPPYHELLPIFTDEISAIRFLEDHGVWERNITNCQFCNHTGILGKDGTMPKMYRCKNSECHKRTPISKNTFFKNSRVSYNIILQMGYLWLNGGTWTQIRVHCGVSEEVATNWLGFYRRQLESLALDNMTTEGGGGQVLLWKLMRPNSGKGNIIGVIVSRDFGFLEVLNAQKQERCLQK